VVSRVDRVCSLSSRHSKISPRNIEKEKRDLSASADSNHDGHERRSRHACVRVFSRGVARAGDEIDWIGGGHSIAARVKERDRVLVTVLATP